MHFPYISCFILFALIHLNVFIDATEAGFTTNKLATPSIISKQDQNECENSSGSCNKFTYHSDISNDHSNEDSIIGHVQSGNIGHIARSEGEDRTLRQVLFVHRHGDRTPLQFWDKDPLKDEPFWTFHGFGQLTHRGKERLFKLGLIMRQRYNNFLNLSVSKHNLESRSSGSLRCIESAQTFLASFLGLNTERSTDAKDLIWDQSSNQLASLWQPSSIRTVSASIDGMLAESANCKNLDREFERLELTEEGKNLKINYKKEAEILRDLLGFNIDAFHKWFWASSLLEVEQSYFPNKFLKQLSDIYPRVETAGNEALKLFQSTLTTRRLRGGLLINNIIERIDSKVKYSEDSKKIVHYSAHDLTLIILLAIIDEYEGINSRPDYASSLMFELHEDIHLYQWYIKVFYMSEVPSSPIELKLNSCEKNIHGRCTLDAFKKLVAKYRIESWAKWMNECDNDILEANPYSINY